MSPWPGVNTANLRSKPATLHRLRRESNGVVLAVRCRQLACELTNQLCVSPSLADWLDGWHLAAHSSAPRVVNTKLISRHRLSYRKCVSEQSGWRAAIPPTRFQTDAKFTLANHKPQLCTLASFKLTCLVFKHITRYPSRSHASTPLIKGRRDKHGRLHAALLP